ncbi:hypothetical protein [Microbacterium sp. NPDC057944]|uniref:hypothetical protein n=1 Tax=Microbacterium sp. NPDC057944 TaxID=3346286 RepID=UPI0036DAFFFE
MPLPFIPSRREAQLISRALLSVARALEETIGDCMSASPPEQSQASVWFRSRDPSDVAKHVMQGFLAVEFATLSAADHLRGLNVLVRSVPPLTTSAVTLARGALESTAKAWYFTTAPNVTEFLLRYLSSRHAEYRYPMHFNESLLSLGGEEVDPTEGAAETLRELSRLGFARPEKVDISSRVAALLDAADGSEGGRKNYSGLSSVAHAEHIGLANFYSFDREANRGKLTLRRELILELVSVLVLAAIQHLAELCRVFGDQAPHIARLEATSERAMGAVLSLFDGAERDASR